MRPLSGNQRPDLLAALMNMSLVLRLPRKMYLCRSSSNVPRLPSFLETSRFAHFLSRSTIPCACHAERHLNGQKWSKPMVFFIILTWKCASCHNGVRFFDIATSTSGPELACFVHFDLEMCFAPQRPALFRNLNFQKCSDNGVFCTFWLGHVLRATTACTFSSLIWPDGSAPAALASLLFDPPEPQIIGKTQCFATSYLFAHLHLLSSDSFSSLIFSLLLFSSL